MSLFLQNRRCTQKQKSMTYIQEKKAVSRNCLYVSPHFEFNKDFKVIIINIFKDLKETIFKELKESMTTMNQQIEILHKEIEIIFLKKNQIEILKLNNAVIEMKNSLGETNSLEYLNSKFKIDEGRINELEDRTIEIIQSETQTKKIEEK